MLSRFKFNNLVLLTFGSLLITVVVLTIALWLYRVSGAAQLDLSRPEYDGLRQQAVIEEDDDFEAKGSITKDVVDEFFKLFEARAERIEAIKAFGLEPLSDSSLDIDR
jgi:hypothetical protein